MRFTSDKLVYVDFNDIIFANLYISKDPKDTQSKDYIKYYHFSCDFETAIDWIERTYSYCLRENTQEVL